jgi:hypothetical protein
MTIGVADLAGVRAKLKRAKEHFGTLESEIKDWAKEQSHTHKFYIRRDGVWHVVTADAFPNPGIRLSIIAGDILHNVRSALDHLITQLVLRDGNEPTKRNEFPICDTPKKFFDEVKFRKKSPELGALYGITVDGDAWAIIEGAQPYAGISSDLTVIRRLSNMDKHRTLCTQLPIPYSRSIAQAIGWNPDAILLEQRFSGAALSLEHVTELVRYRFADQPDPNVHVKGDLPVDPSFGEIVEDGWQVTFRRFNTFINTATSIVDQVSQLPHVIDV